MTTYAYYLEIYKNGSYTVILQSNDFAELAKYRNGVAKIAPEGYPPRIVNSEGVLQTK